MLDNSIIEIGPAPSESALTWLLERMDNPSHPDTKAVKAASWYEQPSGHLLDLIKSSPDEEFRRAQELEYAEVRKLRATLVAQLGLQQEQPQEEPPPRPDDAAPDKLMAMPSPPETLQ